MNTSENSCDESDKKKDGMSTPTLSKSFRSSDSPKITNLTSHTAGSPKVRHQALGYMQVKLVKPGDYVYLNDKLCKVISKTDFVISGLEKNKNNIIEYKINNPNDELRIDMLHPSAYERKVKVTI